MADASGWTARKARAAASASPCRWPDPASAGGLEGLPRLRVARDAGPAVTHRQQAALRPGLRLIGIVRASGMAGGAERHDPGAPLPVPEVEDVARHRGRGEPVAGR